MIKSTVKTFICAFSCVLVSTCLPAQEQTDYNYTRPPGAGQGSEMFLGGSIGASFPVDDYARAGLSQPNPGYMSTGYALNLELEWFGKYDVGFFAAGMYNANTLRTDAFTEMLQVVNDPLQVGDAVAGESYEVSFFTGLAIRQTIKEKWNVIAKFGAGLSYSHYPAVLFPVTNSLGDEFRVERLENNVENYTALGELKLAYSFNYRTKIFINSRYHTGRFEHQNITLRTTQVRTGNQVTSTIDETKNLKIVQLAAGISFAL